MFGTIKGDIGMNISKVKLDKQDRHSPAWQKLCEYIKIVADEQREEFAPREFLGADLFAQIYTLPETIGTLTRVKRVRLYGSNLKRIPPEIGEMSALENFDPYTSYDLCWFPYEITRCKNLRDSRISTRALYGNYKHRKPFPDLRDNPVRYFSETVRCSCCRRELSYQEVNQAWISLCIGTDVVPLLVNLCSEACERQLPTPPPHYLPYAHKGGPDLKQPPRGIPYTKSRKEEIPAAEEPLLKFIRKNREK
ncbi:leucine-rich repeat domain-containing protein [Chitinophaga varians]|uniref:leucine-rich repeat domain-containing protein n=1 Tax=Chitinophaga varians TaxID=2202339 RepID=UPI00165F701A|nr:leucine-rich repeat domain-containing protein [Chitinophaga varians]MBC9909467.1 leucine-rich repeat domain-containing protein [Chitinophaga varians]